MNSYKAFLLLPVFIFLVSCADYQHNNKSKKKIKNYYSSKGFALIYSDNIFEKKIINQKIDNNEVLILHRFLKKNTHVQITNPNTSKSIKAKIYKKTSYPDIFNAVITTKIAEILGLDFNNPYIEIIEIKKNKTFVAKKSNTFIEETNVALKAPVSEIKVDNLNLSEVKEVNDVDESNKRVFTILINDFYYKDSATNLKNDLIQKTKIKDIYVKKITNTKYRLLAGPFKNFNALKTTYISLNNLGFKNLDININ